MDKSQVAFPLKMRNSAFSYLNWLFFREENVKLSTTELNAEWDTLRAKYYKALIGTAVFAVFMGLSMSAISTFLPDTAGETFPVLGPVVLVITVSGFAFTLWGTVTFMKCLNFASKHRVGRTR